MNLSKVLVANRGEIALRIIRSLKETGICAATIYSEADQSCLHVQMADESYEIGAGVASKSYLAAPKIVDLAKRIGADAIHPGYGFLAENAEFASLCEEAGLVFIGPTPENMRLAGDKRAARMTVKNLGVPVVPGSDDALLTLEEAKGVARQITYPLMLKASAGGGGRGIRVLCDEQVLEEEFDSAAAEAGAAFGDSTLYLEKLIQKPRHVEVQILGDGFGDAIHLFERNCSVQRRHQKLIEEAPSPGLADSVRCRIHEAALTVAKGIRYRNAGTIEFLLDENDNFYFMELNARIQVEHPVTEMITGVDLIKSQLSVASGQGIGVGQQEIYQFGYALECRINAEDSDMEFAPDPGKVEEYHAPGGFGVRFDTHLYPGYVIPIYYDSLLGKLIAWGRTRERALKTMGRALQELKIEPIKTTRTFLQEVIQHKEFVEGTYRLDFLEKLLERRNGEAE